MVKKLRHGYTTGACAAAAVLGAALMLRDRQAVDRVELPLPAGFTATFALHGGFFDEARAGCFVIKDAGDDPDVTHGVEVHAELAWVPEAIWRPAIELVGGLGVGTVTKRGLAVPVGEPAINPVPRRMILTAIASVFPALPRGRHLRVTISIPDGESRAQRTLNARLGIVGGLSILGTTGVVRPISHEAWTDTIETALDVALAAEVPMVVLSTGRSSEAAAQKFLQAILPPPLMREGREKGASTCSSPQQNSLAGRNLPEEAFVMMGDYVGYALQACHRKGVERVLVAAQFAKLVKIACGHPQTHVRSAQLDLPLLRHWARNGGLDEAAAKTLECANTAREILATLGIDHPLMTLVAERALARLAGWAPGTALAVLLVGYREDETALFGEWPQDLERNGTS